MSKKVNIEDVQKYFPYISKFRDHQKNIINCILNGKDVMAVLPTSGGKSLCFQYPAMYFAENEGTQEDTPEDEPKKPIVTIVVSPLIALMNDQVENLREKGIPAISLNSQASPEAIDPENPDEHINSQYSKTSKQIMLETIEGKYKLLYVSPEKLSSPKFVRFARKLDIPLIAIDEAHCISLWGYEFRPSYVRIRNFLDDYIQYSGNRPIIAAFTATASTFITKNIIELLNMDVDKESSFRGSTKRENLNLYVNVRNGYRGKYNTLHAYLKKHMDVSGIIYCATIKNVESVYRNLSKHPNNYKVAFYHGRLKKEEKEKNYRAFKDGSCKIMVATNAFGMGIDKGGVRFVVHFDMPKNLESYYQEIGRAGRDTGKNKEKKDEEKKEKSECILYYSENEDKHENRRLLNIGTPELDSETNRKLKKLNIFRFEQMVYYATLGEREKVTSRKLHAIIDDYFDGKDDRSKAIEKTLETISAPMVAQTLKDLEEIKCLYTNETKIAHLLRKGDYAIDEDIVVDISGERRFKKDKTKNDDIKEKPIEIKKGRKIQRTVVFKISQKLSYFDMMVADAVYTLYVWRREKIYPQNILELLSGDTNALMKPWREQEPKPWKEQEPKKRTAEKNNLRFQIIASLDRMANTTITIDQSKGMIKYPFEDEKDIDKISGTFLPIEPVGKNGCYKITGISPLYEYAELANGQLFTIPAPLLSIKQYFKKRRRKKGDGKNAEKNNMEGKGAEGKNTEVEITERAMPNSIENLKLRHYLARRRRMVKPYITESRANRTISFEQKNSSRKGVFEMLFPIEQQEVTYKDKRKRDTLIKKIQIILDDYVRKDFIKRYIWEPSEENKREGCVGVTIDFYREDKETGDGK